MSIWQCSGTFWQDKTIKFNNSQKWKNESKYSWPNIYHPFLYPVAVSCTLFLSNTSHTLTTILLLQKAENLLLVLSRSLQRSRNSFNAARFYAHDWTFLYSFFPFFSSDSPPALRKKPPTTHMPTPMTTLYRGDSQFYFMAVTFQIVCSAVELIGLE